MKKSLSKRIKISKTGKMLRRKMAQDHFKSKHSGSRTRAKRQGMQLNKANVKIFIKYLNN